MPHRRRRGGDPGTLAGVPFAVEEPVRPGGRLDPAGSKIDAERAAGRARRPASCTCLVAAGAVPVGALNMDEYAYGFTTETPLRPDPQPA